MSSDAPVTFLTQDAYDRLAAELEQLSTTGREEIAKRIESAREEGDLKENGGYHAAKDEQGKQEARIRTLQHLLQDRDGQRGAREHRHRRARHRRHGDRRRRRRGLPARQPRDRRRLRARRLQRGLARSAPRSSACKEGEKTSYTAPNGREIAVEIVKVETYTVSESRPRRRRDAGGRSVAATTVGRRSPPARASSIDVRAVLLAARLDAQLQDHLADLQALAVPGVQHLDDVRARLREQLRHARELARAIGQRDRAGSCSDRMPRARARRRAAAAAGRCCRPRAP